MPSPSREGDGIRSRSAGAAAVAYGTRGSVAVVLRLVGAGHVDAEVLGLALGQLGEPHAEGVEVQTGDLLVEVLRQGVDLLVVVTGLGEELDLGDRLVAEAVAHDEARVAGGVAEVHQATLGEHDDRTARGEGPLVDLRLDLGLLDAG